MNEDPPKAACETYDRLVIEDPRHDPTKALALFAEALTRPMPATPEQLATARASFSERLEYKARRTSSGLEFRTPGRRGAWSKTWPRETMLRAAEDQFLERVAKALAPESRLPPRVLLSASRITRRKVASEKAGERSVGSRRDTVHREAISVLGALQSRGIKRLSPHNRAARVAKVLGISERTVRRRIALLIANQKIPDTSG